MRRRQLVHVVQFAVCRAVAVEARSVPGSVSPFNKPQRIPRWIRWTYRTQAGAAAEQGDEEDGTEGEKKTSSVCLPPSHDEAVKIRRGIGYGSPRGPAGYCTGAGRRWH